MSVQEKQSMFGYTLDALTMSQAVDTVLNWVELQEKSSRYVITPNVNLTVLFQKREDFRATFETASMVLADGMPIVVASKLLGKPVPERVTGSNLTANLFETYQQRSDRQCNDKQHSDKQAQEASGNQNSNVPEAKVPQKRLRVFLLGAAAGVAELAAANIHTKWPAVEVVDCYSPPLGFEHSAEENELIRARIAKFKPDILVLGLGSPKQELWIREHHRQIEADVALCVGGTIDFMAGIKTRAPVWMQRAGLEWCHRLATEPKRLAKRYFCDACVFPKIVWREFRRS